MDWTSQAGNVRDQGLCGACYIFAPVQNLEALVAIHTLGFHIELSIQQILDCDFGFSLGCSGGYLEGPFNFMEVNGIETEFIYPYTSGGNSETGECRSTNGPYKIRSFRGLTSGDCNALQTALASKPMTVGITGTQLQLYSEGIFNACD